MKLITSFKVQASIGITLAQVIKTTNTLLNNIDKSKSVEYFDDMYIINNAITINGVSVSVVSHFNVDLDNAMFVAWDKKAQGNNQILLSLNIGSKDHTKLKASLNKSDNFAFKTMLLHEVVHLYQGFKAKEKSYATADINSYIKNKSEFEAIAYQVAYVILNSKVDVSNLKDMQDINYYLNDTLEQLFVTSFDDNNTKLYTAIMTLLQGKTL